MKAISISSFGDPSVFKSVDVPIPQPRQHEVRIRIKAVGFNPVDCKMREGVYPGHLPMILGVECSGVIDAIGEPYHEFSIGDPVMALIFGQASSNGAYAEYVCVPKAFVIKKPEELSFAQAATVPLAGLTAYRALIATSAIEEGKSAVILGATGGVGSFAIQLAKAYKAHPIFVTAGSEESAQYLIRHFQIPKEWILFYKGMSMQQTKERLLQMNQGKLIYSVFDFVGGTTKELCFSIVDYSGHVASILPEGKDFQLNLWTRGESPAFQKNLSVHFIYVGAEATSGPKESWNNYQAQLKELASLIHSKDIHVVEPEITGKLSVEAVQEAHRRLETHKVKGKLAMMVES